MKICVAGKNQIAIDAIEELQKIGIKKNNLVALCNNNDFGIDEWQPSYKKYCQRNSIKIENLENLYSEKDLIFISLEYDKIIKTDKFLTKHLFNIHFSALPEYKGMYTSILPILDGKNYSGVTLHIIDNGIDTGQIIDQKIFDIPTYSTSLELYFLYLSNGIELFRNNIYDLINGKYISQPQSSRKSSYFGKHSINFNNKEINCKQTAFQLSNWINGFSFRPYQLPQHNNEALIRCKIGEDKSNTKPGIIIYEDVFHLEITTIDYNVIVKKDNLYSILMAAKSNNLEEIKSYYKKGFDFKDKNSRGWNALMVACYHGSRECVNFLINNQPELINSRNNNGTTPLMYATTNFKNTGNKDIINLLVENNASLSQKDLSGKSVLDYHPNTTFK